MPTAASWDFLFLLSLFYRVTSFRCRSVRTQAIESPFVRLICAAPRTNDFFCLVARALFERSENLSTASENLSTYLVSSENLSTATVTVRFVQGSAAVDVRKLKTLATLSDLFSVYSFSLIVSLLAQLVLRRSVLLCGCHLYFNTNSHSDFTWSLRECQRFCSRALRVTFLLTEKDGHLTVSASESRSRNVSPINDIREIAARTNFDTVPQAADSQSKSYYAALFCGAYTKLVDWSKHVTSLTLRVVVTVLRCSAVLEVYNRCGPVPGTYVPSSDKRQCKRLSTWRAVSCHLFDLRLSQSHWSVLFPTHDLVWLGKQQRERNYGIVPTPFGFRCPS